MNDISPTRPEILYKAKEIAQEIVRCNALDRVYIALDYFDASINRVSAWVTGYRSMQSHPFYMGL